MLRTIVTFLVSLFTCLFIAGFASNDVAICPSTVERV